MHRSARRLRKPPYGHVVRSSCRERFKISEGRTVGPSRIVVSKMQLENYTTKVGSPSIMPTVVAKPLGCGFSASRMACCGADGTRALWLRRPQRLELSCRAAAAYPKWCRRAGPRRSCACDQRGADNRATNNRVSPTRALACRRRLPWMANATGGLAARAGVRLHSGGCAAGGPARGRQMSLEKAIRGGRRHRVSEERATAERQSRNGPPCAPSWRHTALKLGVRVVRVHALRRARSWADSRTRGRWRLAQERGEDGGGVRHGARAARALRSQAPATLQRAGDGGEPRHMSKLSACASRTRSRRPTTAPRRYTWLPATRGPAAHGPQLVLASRYKSTGPAHTRGGGLDGPRGPLGTSVRSFVGFGGVRDHVRFQVRERRISKRSL